MAYRGYKPSQNKATQKYSKENLEQITFRVHKGQKEYYKKAAEQAGLSFARFAITALNEKIERDKLILPEQSEEKRNGGNN